MRLSIKGTFSIVVLLAFCLAMPLSAQKQEGLRLAAYAEYGYNYTWEHFAGLAATATLPVKSYFEVDGGLKFISSQVLGVTANARVLFPLKYGRLQLENRILYRALFVSNINEATAGIALGYHYDYVTASVGAFSRLISPMGNPYRLSNQERYLVEPFNLLYSIELRLRPERSIWNLGGRVSNYDNFIMERFNEFIFTLSGRYSPSKHLDILAETTLRPSGVFHVSANFYEFYTRAGICYKW